VPRSFFSVRRLEYEIVAPPASRQYSTVLSNMCQVGRTERYLSLGRIRVGPWLRTDWPSNRYWDVNSHSEVVWKLAVKPGESVTREVKYHYFARQ